MALAIPVKDPGRCIRVVRGLRLLAPLGHFSRENVELAVAINVGNLLAMAMNHVPIQKIVADMTLKPALIDRFLVSAAKGDVRAIIVINKCDLVDVADLQARLRKSASTAIPMPQRVPPTVD